MNGAGSLPLRILIADDHPVVRSGLCTMLSACADLSVVCEAGDGTEAVAGWRAHRPDLGLIDLGMPGLDGFGVVRGIRRIDAEARLVVVTTMGGDQDVYRALQAGADGFLLKDCGREELATCVRSVARGAKYLQAAAAASLAEHLTCAELTARELEALAGLARGHGNKAIARQLGIAEGTVKTHVKNILAKLGASSRTEAVGIALRRGVIHEVDACVAA